MESRAQAFDLLNKGERASRTSFDAEIGGITYSDVELEISTKDFIATVTVTGSREQSAKDATKLGAYTIFDLSRQRLGRSTVLHLPASNLPYLHFEIAGPVHPEQVTAVEVEQQTATAPVFVTVAATAPVTTEGKKSVSIFMLPAHVPVDRVVVVPGVQPAQFSRAATVELASAAPAAEGSAPASTVVSPGTLIRVHTVENGLRLDREQLTLDAPQNYADGPTRWTVTVDNGDDAPLPIQQVRLEMLEHKLCFEATAGARYTLFYGDAALTAPRYDYATLFADHADAARATLGAEQRNATFKTRPDERAFTEKHPALLSIVLVAVVALLGFIAFRSMPARKKQP